MWDGGGLYRLLTLYLGTGCRLCSGGCMEQARSQRSKSPVQTADVARELTVERLTIGELAERAHVNRETVRYYERRRLLPRPSRSISGFRVFTDDSVRRLRFIRHAQELGFSLNEIRELLALRVKSVDTCDRVREQAEAKIVDIKKKIKALQHMN